MTTIRILLVVALAGGGACGTSQSEGGGGGGGDGKKHLPLVTSDKLPAGLAPMELGKTTEDELKKAYPTMKREADRSLGGDMTVMRNDKPAIILKARTRASLKREYDSQQIPPGSYARELEATEGFLADDSPFQSVTFDLVDLGGGKPVLQGLAVTRLRAEGEAPCAWARKVFGDDPESVKCEGTNRVFGRGKGEGIDYCAGSPDGKRNVIVECSVGTRHGAAYEHMSYWVAID